MSEILSILKIKDKDGNWVGIPGLKGEDGTAATDAQVEAAVDEWLEENISPESGYVLDRTLTLENAAAPADLVGDIKDDVTAMNTATASDVGKALKAKTVSSGKVTEWEFGEAGGGGEDYSNLIIVSNVEPTDEINKLWIKGSGSQTVSIPTSAELDAKITAPVNPTSGQFLVYNGSAWTAQTVSSANGVSF